MLKNNKRQFFILEEDENKIDTNAETKFNKFVQLAQKLHKQIKKNDIRTNFENYSSNIFKRYQKNQNSKYLDKIILNFENLQKNNEKLEEFFSKEDGSIERVLTEEERVAREKRIGGRWVELSEEEKMKKQLTPDFNLSHFLFCNLPSDDILPNIKLLAKNLQVISDKIKKKIIIISAYRSEERNKVVSPNTKDSQHTKGTAADINIPGLSQLILYKFIENLIKAGAIKEGGLGIYDDFVHYDIRGEKERWDYRTKNKDVFTFSDKEKKIIKNLISSLGS